MNSESLTPLKPAGPIIVVGSPRSGTSILTWCLGQHPNLLGLEESNWMDRFAIDLAVAFRRGSARGERSQFSSMGIERDQFMQEIGTAINGFILRHRQAFEDRRSRLANPSSPDNHAAFKISRDRSEPKSRWVDGTPEYSRGIGGLRKLFPEARFIHVVRDCDLVAPSMLHFDRVAGTRLVETEEEAYQYWLACVRAAVSAERAFGPEIVCRIFLEDLIRKPRESMQRILSFVGEPFAAACLEPLIKRINSSNVAAEEAQRSPAGNPSVVDEARELWKTVRENPPPESPDSNEVSRIEEEFERRVEYVHDLEAECARTRQVHSALHREFTERTEWALRLDQDIEKKNRQILEMQEEFAERTAWALNLQAECAKKDALILSLKAELRKESAPPSDT